MIIQGLLSENGGKAVEGKIPFWQEHPKPQMKRNEYMILNGAWKLNGQAIRMPFPPQSLLSGYRQSIGKELEYRTEFEFPADFKKKRVILHFGAVDQKAQVWLNERYLGDHEGGYLPFSFDVTEVIDRKKTNTLVVKATDRLDKNLPYGKQSAEPGGMWYTEVSGIWQTVWLENVPDKYISGIKYQPDLDGVRIRLEGEVDSFSVEVKLEETSGSLHICKKTFDGKEGYLKLRGYELKKGEAYEPKLWSPKQPHLYEVKITAGEDCVDSYFALRTIGIGKKNGAPAVLLNEEPIFLHGVLDQGYYCDGLYLPACEEEYENDINRMKELGFNTLRKHIKIEPEYFYYACDKLGMLVIQDMVNNGEYSFLRDTAMPNMGMKKRNDKKKIGKTETFFRQHMLDTLDHLYNHPSIVVYTIFNEGWGQFCSDEMYELAKVKDKSRLYDSTSGWFWQEKSDFDSEHVYFKNRKLTVKDRPVLLSECGGYTLADESMQNHTVSKEKKYGYGDCKSQDELMEKIEALYREMVLPSVKAGVCGCIYTQLSDVEEEINGLYSYDRKVCKVAKDKMRALSEELLSGPIEIKVAKPMGYGIPEKRAEEKPEEKVTAKPEEKVTAKPEGKVTENPEEKAEEKEKIEVKVTAKPEDKPEVKIETKAKETAEEERKEKAEPEQKSKMPTEESFFARGRRDAVLSILEQKKDSEQ